MNYEIVTLQEKHIAGLRTHTANSEPDMGAKIGGLWNRLYGEGVMDTIAGRQGTAAYGLYTNYESDVHGDYDVIAGCEAAPGTAQPQGIVCASIPAGRYAKFSLVVDMQGGEMGEAWDEIWQLPLQRAYTVDFEEYLPGEDMGKAPVNIYIALAG